VKRDLFRIPVDPERVITTCGMQEENVQAGYRRDQEGNEEVEGEKAG